MEAREGQVSQSHTRWQLRSQHNPMPRHKSNVVAVRSSDQNDSCATGFAIPNGGGARWGSNYGPELSVVALGVNVNTSYLGIPNQTTFYGTSAAVPQVAALTARILSINPNVSPSHVRNIIELTADTVGRSER